MTFYSRKAWGARPPEARYRLEPRRVVGVALHWPGMPHPLRSVSEVQAALRGWQRQHMDTDQLSPGGASDIAYQVAIDQAGNWYQLRGLRHRSGANGNAELNEAFGAFLLVVAEGEQPSAAMIRTVNRRLARFRHLFPGAVRLVGHRDIRPGGTACPGPLVGRCVEAGDVHL